MNDSKDILSGAIAGLASRMVIAPFDMLKIRTQLGGNSRGTLWLLGDIMKKEGGPMALWNGNMPGLYLYVLYGGIQFPLQKRMAPHLGEGVAGATASTIATIITYPLDLLRTRRTLLFGKGALANSEYGNNVFSMTKRILSTEKSIFKGLGVGVLQVAPAMGISFYIHEKVFLFLEGKIESMASRDLIGGITAGFVSKLSIMPFEVLRRHLQIEDLHFLSTLPDYIKKSPSNIKTTSAMIRWIYKEKGGIPAFYRGLSLALAKAIPSTGIIFMVYGIINRW